MAASVAALARDPTRFPHRIDLASDRIEFVPTTRDALRAATFLDGRTDFSAGAPRSAPLGALLRHVRSPQPTRMILHMAFGGSTLLTRLLDHPGRTLVLREPQCLVDLASVRADRDRHDAPASDVRPVLRGALALLGRRWDPDEAVVIKPTNWINNLALDIVAADPGLRPLFLTTGRETFVRAVFRGGSERIAFAARAAVHLSTRGRENAELVASALARDVDDQRRLGALAAVLHAIQMRLFAESATAGGWGAAHWLRFEDLLTDPFDAARRALTALDLAVPDAALAQAVDRWAGVHAKQPAQRFDRAAEKAADAALMEHQGELVADALAWAERALD